MNGILAKYKRKIFVENIIHIIFIQQHGVKDDLFARRAQQFLLIRGNKLIQLIHELNIGHEQAH